MRLLIHTAPTPAEDLALEEAIHTAVDDHAMPNTWRLWQAAVPAVVLGTGQESAKEVFLGITTQENIPVLRRHSGGGAVVIGPGTINYSAFYRFKDLPGSETIRGAMAWGLKPVIDLLESWGMTVRMEGLSDLAILGADGQLRKIAGNSQSRKRHSVVVHGTMLADPDWARLRRLLPPPTKMPDYRAGREHRDFLTSLKENGAPTEVLPFTEGLLKFLPSDILIAAEPDAEEKRRAALVLQEKYGNPAWNLRR